MFKAEKTVAKEPRGLRIMGQIAEKWPSSTPPQPESWSPKTGSEKGLELSDSTPKRTDKEMSVPTARN